MKQSDSHSAQERKEHDLKMVQHFFKALVPDGGDINIKTCFRLINKKNKDDQSVKPLKVILNSRE